MDELLARLAEALPPAALVAGEDIAPRYQEDRRGRPSARPRFVLRPGSTAEVAAVLALCSAARQPLVTQGGRTGLSGAHRIGEGEAVLSLERMTALGPVDAGGATVLAEAGVPLERVQDAAAAAGLLFGVDIGARGTATVGGNVATNAGGIRVLRYGMFRAQVAGLEAVLADGTVLRSLRGLAKDNSGYDLSQLFIGSEGTLGVVTRALLRLHPRPAEEAAALIALPSLAAVGGLLAQLRRDLGPALSAYELMLPGAYDGVVAHLRIAPPLSAPAPVYVLAEAQSAREGGSEAFLSSLMAALEAGLAEDAVVSRSARDFAALWALRDGMADFIRACPDGVSADISLPPARLAEFLPAAEAAVRAVDPAARFLVFGHYGDGNLHYALDSAARQAALDPVYRLAALHGGSISAEHGIGVDKKGWLPLTRSAGEIATMRRLKSALDPAGILNPGRIFDPAG